LRIVVLDLNNFSRYPTMSVGYLVALLRGDGHDVQVVSPFSVGVAGYRRIQRPRPLGQYEAMLRYWTATTKMAGVRKLRGRITAARSPANKDAHRSTIDAVRSQLAEGTDLLLISAYSMYRDICAPICAEAERRGVPVVAGGPLFTVPEITQEWLKLPGLTAVFAGEPEKRMRDVIDSVTTTRAAVPGLIHSPDQCLASAAPLMALDDLPFPDYSDFPWDKYPNRIVPMMTDRGCGWGVCTFCSDVHTAAGREFRSRSPENVLDEVSFQNERHDTGTFTFLDLKLNSDLDVWHGLIDRAQSVVPGCEWTASVHVGVNGVNGLGVKELKAARRAGLSRMTTGLESGSRKILNAMGRGTNPDALSDFLRNAFEAGISVRLTAIIGYPGEEPADVAATEAFLDRHYQFVDRVVLNRLALSPLTPLAAHIRRRPEKFPAIQAISQNVDTGLLDHENHTFTGKGHREAAFRLLRTVHRINRKPLKGASLTFEGVM